jgi:pimeloyl-ACP methyl ester carboxylesterase
MPCRPLRADACLIQRLFWHHARRIPSPPSCSRTFWRCPGVHQFGHVAAPDHTRLATDGGALQSGDLWHQYDAAVPGRAQLPTERAVTEVDILILPRQATGKRLATLIAGAQLEVITGGSHGIMWTHAEEVNRIILDFLGRSLDMVRQSSPGVMCGGQITVSPAHATGPFRIGGQRNEPRRNTNSE